MAEAFAPGFLQTVIFMVHFVFISLSCLGSWGGLGYIFYNSVLMILIVWSLYDRTSSVPLQLALYVNIVSIVLDIFYLAFKYPSRDYSARFSAVMAILHLVARPFSTLCMVNVVRDVSREPEFFSNIFPTVPTQGGYEDIEQVQPPRNNRSTDDFSTAQQI